MLLALAQINPTIGDLGGNAALAARFVAQARRAHADLVVLPELCISGYPPKDLLLQEGFVSACAAAAHALGEQHSQGLTLVYGTTLPLAHTHADGKSSSTTNSLLAYRDGALIARYDKRLLPTYDVFDEDRYFVPGDRPVVITVPAHSGPALRVGLSICEDLWRAEDAGFSHRYLTRPDPVAELIHPPDGSPGAQVILNPSASPFALGKSALHHNLLERHAAHHRVVVAAVNQVGGNDELVFDGSARIFDASGSLAAAAPAFEEHLLLADINATGAVLATDARPAPDLTNAESLYRALVLGVRDYCRKTGFNTALLGLSGGIDSAVTAVIAAAALGPANVRGISLPSRYSSAGSRDDARALAAKLGLNFETIAIEQAFTPMLDLLQPAFAGRAPDVTEENLQSRIRGTILMALSNKSGAILLTTGNKSELAVGYCTLYGDMNGGLAVLSDVTKHWVYTLARWINANPSRLGFTPTAGGATPPIPESSILKPPSAELRPDQTDQDTLPPYDTLDEIVRRYVERRQSPSRIVSETGFDPALVARMIRMIDLSEYKRKQSAIGIKVTSVAFGSGRRYPIAQRYRPL